MTSRVTSQPDGDDVTMTPSDSKQDRLSSASSSLGKNKLLLSWQLFKKWRVSSLIIQIAGITSRSSFRARGSRFWKRHSEARDFLRKCWQRLVSSRFRTGRASHWTTWDWSRIWQVKFTSTPPPLWSTLHPPLLRHALYIFSPLVLYSNPFVVWPEAFETYTWLRCFLRWITQALAANQFSNNHNSTSPLNGFVIRSFYRLSSTQLYFRNSSQTFNLKGGGRVEVYFCKKLSELPNIGTALLIPIP